MGDFLAGWFSIPAFLWLVVGMLLQSRELSLQRKELEEVRKLGTEQALAAKRQAQATERATAEQSLARSDDEKARAAAARPRFLVSWGGKSGTRLSVASESPFAYDVEVLDLVDNRTYPVGTVDTNQRGFGMKGRDKRSEFEIRYNDENGKPGGQVCKNGKFTEMEILPTPDEPTGAA